MMTMRTWWAVAVACTLTICTSQAQEPPKPGPEHEMLKKWEGTWDLTMTMEGNESKGTSTFKMELGGLWLSSTLECDLFGTKFQGKGLDTYDAKKKKFISVWADSMSTSPMTLEGTYDKKTQLLTMTGMADGPDGKPVQHKTITQWKDDNTVEFTMYMGEAKDPMLKVVYKRKK